MRAVVCGLWMVAAPAWASDVTLDLSGRLLDVLGEPLSDGVHEVAVRLYDAPTGAVPVWEGTVTVDVVGGVFAAEIGAGSPPLSVAALDGERWLELEVDPPSAPLTPRKRLSSVPRAAVSEVTASVRYQSQAPACDAGHLGAMYFNPTQSALQVCAQAGAGATWLTIGGSAATAYLVNESGSRRWSDGSFAANCQEYRNPAPPYVYTGAVGSGVYRLNTASGAVDVFCDMVTQGGGWTYVAEPGRSRTDPTDTVISPAGSYHRYIYDLDGMAWNQALVVRRTGYQWCNSWGGAGDAWTVPGTVSMGVAYDTSTFHYNNGNFSPYRWIVQPYSISTSCSSCWDSNNSTLSPVSHTSPDGGTTVILDPPGSGHTHLEISNFDAFIGQAGGCNGPTPGGSWSAYIR